MYGRFVGRANVAFIANLVLDLLAGVSQLCELVNHDARHNVVEEDAETAFTNCP